MNNYDFLNLSPFEFEILTRDLLQAHLKIQLESFGTGRDQGIDLRYSSNGDLIVQCKRYKAFQPLFRDLKKEVSKVISLNPSSYIVVTSVSLLPDQKEKIKTLFNPFILGCENIYGREDLNNLLAQFPNIEKDNFKLWLSSTNILQIIVNSQIINRSKFALEEIRNRLNIYVQNTSFYEASKILQDNHYVLISGIPGIGKTTLAEILVFDALANGFQDFIHLSESIKDGFTMFNEDRSQVFLFDDFLGSNFLENNISTNEETQIIRFIKKVKQSKNKLLIFTTREYILNQAKQKFERFDQEQFVKCILDLSKYTTMVKARILYNHLFFNEIPYNYILQIINQDYLLKIIQHPNYSPRIIEYFSSNKIWENYDAEIFPSELIKIFDSPFKVWQHAFENQISDLSRVVLYNMVISGPKLDYNQLYKQVLSFSRLQHNNYNIAVNNITFKSALKELDNSFIDISRLLNGNTIIKFHNPSIQDFLIDYINDEENLKADLIRSAVYLNQLLTIFSNVESFEVSKRLTLSDRLGLVLQTKIFSDFDILEYSTEFFTYSIPSNDDVIVLKLNSIRSNLKAASNDKIDSFIKEKFKPLIYSENIQHRSVVYFSRLLAQHFNEDDELDILKILLNITPSIWSEEDLRVLEYFDDAFPESYQLFKDEHWDEYQEIFIDIVSDKASFDSENIEDLEGKISGLNEIERYYDVDTHFERSKLINQIDKIRRNEEEEQMRAYLEGQNSLNSYENSYHSKANYFDEENLKKGSIRVFSEKEKIENIFKSLE